jgi:dihydroorotate dehydrogenase (fumarate)
VLRRIQEEVATWLERHEYKSLRQACGSMNMQRCPDPTYYDRGNYLRILRAYRPLMSK